MGLIGLIAEVLVLGCCAAAVVTNGMLLAACDFMEIKPRNNLSFGSGSLGLWHYQEPGTEECVDLPDIEGDGWFRTAQVCGVISLCSGAILFAFGLFKQCIIPLPCTQLVMDLSSVLTQVCLALVYGVWASNFCDDWQCFLGDRGHLLFLTQIFWFAAGVFTRCMRPGRWERRDEIAANKKAKQEAKKRQEAEDELKKREEELAAKEAESEEREDVEEGGP